MHYMCEYLMIFDFFYLLQSETIAPSVCVAVQKLFIE